MREWASLGLELVIFQAVHDARWGAYYASALPWLPPWNGTCTDVVEAVLAAADGLPGMRVLLSAEFVVGESDSVTDPTIMAQRLAILAELAATAVPAHPRSFAGWYFSSEAYLTPLFTTDFLAYIGNLSAAAAAHTPGSLVFTSPYGTRGAVNSPEFVAQLRALGAAGVDVIAYQDEVGCVRDELPVATVEAAWRTLRAAHDAAGPGAPALWANIESFTWEARPNNVTSALIPAAWPRVLAQLRAAAAARVDRVITFTAEAMYETPSSPAPWGPPSGDAVRLRAAYEAAFFEHTPAAALLSAAVVAHAVPHEGVGAAVAAAPAPLPPGGGGGGGGGGAATLTDGLTGSENPYDAAWVAFPTAVAAGGGCGGAVELVLDLGAPRSMAALGVHALQVPPVWFRDGSGAAPVARNLSAALPAAVSFAVSNASAAGPWTPVGVAAPARWAQEGYDVRTDVLAVAAAAVARWVRAGVTPGVVPSPPPAAVAAAAAAGAAPCPLVLLSEVFVLEQAVVSV